MKPNNPAHPDARVSAVLCKGSAARAGGWGRKDFLLAAMARGEAKEGRTASL